MPGHSIADYQQLEVAKENPKTDKNCKGKKRDREKDRNR